MWEGKGKGSGSGGGGDLLSPPELQRLLPQDEKFSLKLPSAPRSIDIQVSSKDYSRCIKRGLGIHEGWRGTGKRGRVMWNGSAVH